jgi:DNA repair exonuclease SbcCD ATPase subunit
MTETIPNNPDRIFPDTIPAGDMAERHYKIINLKAQNFLKLKAVDITPAGSVIEITGKNGAGKSSVLKAIWSVFANRDLSKEISSPIRSGEESGSVSVDLGDMIITRSWTSEGSYLRVENKTGAVYKSPQALLDKLKTSLSFDPLAFTRMTGKEQRATLLKILNVDVDAYDRDRDAYFSTRTDINRKIKDLTAQMQPYQMLPADLPKEPISAAGLIQKIREAEQNNQRLSQVDSDISKLEMAVKEYEELIRAGKNRLESLIAERENLTEISISDMEVQLENIEDLNTQIQKKQTLDGILSQLSTVTKEADRLTDEMNRIDAKKKEALQNSTFPDPDISISPDGVLYRDIPLSQCSAAEQIRVSVAMGSALNPGLRVLLIQDGSLLDSSSRKIVEEIAKEKDMQIWIETVSETGESGIIIEDGEILS